MENEIGEYGRTNLGKIIKFAWLEDEKGKKYENKVILVDLMLKETYPYYYFKKGEYIVKHSPELLDLIKAEDTIKIKIGLYTSFVHFIVDEDDLISIKAQIEANFWTIDKIYTKEMMESISYKVTKMCKTYIKVVRKM